MDTAGQKASADPFDNINLDDNLSELERKLKVRKSNKRRYSPSQSSISRSRSRSLKSQKKAKRTESKRKRHHHESRRSKRHRHRSPSSETYSSAEESKKKKHSSRNKKQHKSRTSKDKPEKIAEEVATKPNGSDAKKPAESNSDKDNKEKEKTNNESPNLESLAQPEGSKNINVPVDTRRRERHEKKDRKKHKSHRDRDTDRHRDHKRSSHKRRKSRNRSRDSGSSSLSFQPNWSDSSEKRREKRKKRRTKDKVRNQYYHYSSSPEKDPLQAWKNNFMNNTVNDPTKPRQFWDGFQWVTKGVGTTVQDPTQQLQTKKMRRVVISNLPIYLGLREKDVRNLITEFIKRNYLNDPGNQEPVVACELNGNARTATIELSTVEEASRLSKVNNMNILSVKCKVTKVAESMFGPTTSLGTLIEQAQTTAKAQAIAHNAMNSILGDSNTIDSLKVGRLNLQQAPASKILKVMNLVEPEMAKNQPKEEIQEIFEDIFSEFSKVTEIVTGFIVMPHQCLIGAECGSIFLEFDDKSKAEKVTEEFMDMRYKQRLIRMTCIPEEVYINNFASISALT